MRYEKSVQAVVSSIDPSLFLIERGSMTMQIASVSGSQRFETVLVTAFAAMALCLTAMGLYATLAAMVAARTREIGLRMALGSDRSGVAMLVLGRATALLLVGLIFGGAATITASRLLAASDWLRPLLFGVTWFEPGTYSVILAVLGATSIAACLVPTWNAVRVDPMHVLRDE
jgi:ABC-type antimicrobial peptide transport system permease subunit